MGKAPANQKSPEAERRSGEDRRNVEAGPPSKRERRRGLESRQPEVLERDMSDSEWAALSQQLPAPKK